ncbi:MAG: hypothetical protein LAO09_21105 [Acidobacteriia bacterium]|nr:hypothetical protein [Terriglobia bacterium]
MKYLPAVKTHNLLLASCWLLLVIPALAENVQRNPNVVYDLKHDVSLPLSVLAKNAPPPKPGMTEMREHRSPKHFFSISNVPDPVVQTEVLPDVHTTNLLSFDAITGVQGGAIPPDTNGSVGSTQYVLITNFDYAVYDKTTGNTILPPTRINVIWSGFGGQCQTNNGGDPIVLWDKMAQRWLVEQLEYFGGPNLVCVAVSTTADATGSYNRYSFSFGSALPDYPHISVWPDAYYLAVNSFGQGFGQPCALDRNAMLAGTAAAMVCFSPNSANFGFLPSDVDGNTLPPAGAPNHFLEIGNNNTSLKYFDFHVDFINTNNSTFTGPHTITVPAFTVLCGGGGGACIHQPSPGSLLDALGDRLMYRNAYRNFGDHESMVVAHSVRPGGGSTADAATRWYELRATPPGSAFTLYQAGTLQDKKMSVWMASVAMDKQGNIALGASVVSSTTVKPTIGYTGRIPSDPLGKMESAKLVAKGAGVQTGTNRWGDYSSMSVDSSDDCTFWYAQEYYKANGTNWIIHINSFKFTSCN